MTLVTELVIGLSLGAVYALLAAGVTVVYQAVRLPNVAVVAIGTVAAVLHADLMSPDGRFGTGLGWWPALAVSVAVAAVLGLACDLATRGLRGQIVPGLTALLGISAVLLAGVNAVWGSEAKFLPPPWAGDAFRQGDLLADRSDLATLAVAAAAGLGLAGFFRTRPGLALRAQALDPEGARMAGVDPGAVARLAWVVSSALGAVAMTLVLHPVLSNTYETTVYVALAVAAAAVGGFRSLPRAAIAGVALGVVPSVLDTGGSRVGGIGNLVAFLILAAVFFRRPGLIGRPALDEVFSSASADNTPAAARRRAAAVPALGGALPAWVRRAGALALAAGLAVAVPAASSDAAVAAWTRGIAVFLICASIVILFGWTGDVALGQVAFAGIGAYLVATLSVRAGLPHLVAIPVAALLALPYAAAVGIPAFRSRGRLAFAALSLLGVLTAGTLLWGPEARWFTRSLTELRRPGWMEALSGRPAVSYYLVALATAALVVWFATNLRRSRVGRALAAGRDSEAALRSLGIDPAHYRLVALGFSSVVAALGGILMAYGTRPPDATRFAVFFSVQYFLYTVVGGARSLAGTAVVVAAFEVVPALDGGGPPAGPASVLLLGGLAVLTVGFAPGGLAGVVGRAAARLVPVPTPAPAMTAVAASGFSGARPGHGLDGDPFVGDPFAGDPLAGDLAADPFGSDPFDGDPFDGGDGDSDGHGRHAP